jgi:hypothetical protein
MSKVQYSSKLCAHQIHGMSVVSWPLYFATVLSLLICLVFSPSLFFSALVIPCSLMCISKNGMVWVLQRLYRPPEVLMFSSLSLFESVYFLMHWSDCHDHRRTVLLQTVLIMNMFSYLVPHALGCSRIHAFDTKEPQDPACAYAGYCQNYHRRSFSSSRSLPRGMHIGVGVEMLSRDVVLYERYACGDG